jgi:hypothetical protein
MATKAAVSSLFPALLMTRFWIPVGVGLGAAAGWEAAAVAAGTLVWPVSGPALPGVRFAEQAVKPAAASKARPTTIPRRFTIVRTLHPLCVSQHILWPALAAGQGETSPPDSRSRQSPVLDRRDAGSGDAEALAAEVQVMPVLAEEQTNGPTPVAVP